MCVRMFSVRFCVLMCVFVWMRFGMRVYELTVHTVSVLIYVQVYVCVLIFFTVLIKVGASSMIMCCASFSSMSLGPERRGALMLFYM